MLVYMRQSCPFLYYMFWLLCFCLWVNKRCEADVIEDNCFPKWTECYKNNLKSPGFHLQSTVGMKVRITTSLFTSTSKIQCRKYIREYSILRRKINKSLKQKSNKDTSQSFQESRLDGAWLSSWNLIHLCRRIMSLRPTWNTEKSISKLVHLFVWLLRNLQIHFELFCYKSTSRTTCSEEEMPHSWVLLL